MGLGVNALAPPSSVYKRVMYYFRRWLLRLLYRLLGKTPNDMPMVQYWKRNHGMVAAKVMKSKDGALVMKMEGEKEIFPGFPRGHLLFGTLSKLKHEIKVQIFNETWEKLENGKTYVEIARDIKDKLVNGLRITDGKTIPVGKVGEPIMDHCLLDMVPPEKMVPAVREIWRALTVLEEKEPKLRWFKLAFTYILQEDDAYRFRFQWFSQILTSWLFKKPVERLRIALGELENAEIVGDMKAKQRLLKRVIEALMYDQKVRGLFIDFFKEVDWKKVRLTKADLFHFRGKWFKVDWDFFVY